jgi:hypothetical protein
MKNHSMAKRERGKHKLNTTTQDMYHGKAQIGKRCLCLRSIKSVMILFFLSSATQNDPLLKETLSFEMHPHLYIPHN